VCKIRDENSVDSTLYNPTAKLLEAINKAIAFLKPPFILSPLGFQISYII
jgi:hypothetical protein